MGTGRGIKAEELLLSRLKGRVLKLCVRLGIAMSALALLPAMASTDDRERRIAAIVLLLICWVAAEYYRKRSNWVPDVLADRGWVLAAAAFTALPYAIDGNAQSDAFMGVVPLAGIAAVACRRREVIIFAIVSIAAYVVGVSIGSGGVEAIGDAEHPFDAVQQIAAIGSTCGLFAFAVLGFRRFTEQIPRVESNSKVAGKQPSKLTKREREILGLLSKGQTRTEIAEGLFISAETVKSHFDNIRAKLDVSTQEEALAIYLKESRGND
jgi:DNA-binding CsgD family transcriptional regulator